MDRGRKVWEAIAMGTELDTEVFPGQPLVELAGDRRLIIEGHRGVLEYSPEKITVGVSYGLVRVLGRRLELSRMNAEQLVIRGWIDCVTLCRRGES